MAKQQHERATEIRPGDVNLPAAGVPKTGELFAAAIYPQITPPEVGDEEFSAVFESSGEALLITDSSGVIYRANRQAERFLGLEESRTRGIGLGTVLAEQSGAQVLLLCDSAQSTRRAAVEAVLATGQPIRIELRALLPRSQALLLHLDPCPRGQDFEADHGTKGERRLLEAELRSVLDSVTMGIVVFDAAGRVRFWNTRLGELLCINSRNLQQLKTGQELHESLIHRLRNGEKISLQPAASGQGEREPQADELEILRPERRVLKRLSRPVIESGGRVAGWLELYWDVTAERQIQSKMLQTEKMAAVGQLVSGIAHELNNPLTAIMGYVELLLGQGLKAGQLSKVRKVHQQAERARRIVKNLLYFARQNKPERGRVDVNEIIERTVALRSYELKVENISIRCDLARNLPQTMADPYQLQQVLLNLLINAEQALVGGRRRGRVWIRTRSLTRAAERRIVIEIADDGPGIPPDVSQRIFDPFFTTKPPGVGTGLGLSIVYGIVNQHGGEVNFESGPGGGAKFVVELPVVSPPAKPATTLSYQPSRTATRAATGRILAIEDEPSVAQLIVDVLREEGYQVEALLDSKEGLAKLSRETYDLIICDLRMPGLDGPGFYDALVRAGSPMRDRVLFITGDTLSPRTTEFLKPRKLPCLAKPFLIEELKLAVHKLVSAADGKHRNARRREVSIPKAD